MLQDEALPVVNDDPRVVNGRKIVRKKGGGRNTESFDPKDSLVRPDMRIILEKPSEKMKHKLKHDDVVIVPGFFCDEDDWSIYYKLLEEMRGLQASKGGDSQWISWAEGAHLITKNPVGSATFDKLTKRIMEYLDIKAGSEATRFNWYRTCRNFTRTCHNLTRTCHNLTRTCHNFTRRLRAYPPRSIGVGLCV